MQKITTLYIFLCISLHICPLFGQKKADKHVIISPQKPWQEQVLQVIDFEEIGEDAYNELLEEMAELTLWSDTLSSHSHRIKQQLFLSSYRCLNTRAGYQNQTAERQEANKAFLGDPWRQSIRYRAKYDMQWQAGFNMEKDAGEPWRSRFPGFDSWHAFVQYQPAPNRTDIHTPDMFAIENAVIGHYRLRMGYGLTMNQSFSLGKQYFSEQMLQSTNRILPFASNAEADYMQGAAVDLRIGQRFYILPYISMLQIDGNLSKEQTLTTLYTDGMHRTQTEQSHRHASWQLVMGTRVSWKTRLLELGLHILNTQFQYPYQRKEMSHNHNYFRGKSLTQFATDYQLSTYKNTLKGEFALDDQLGFASLTSLQTYWSDDWQTGLIYHYYSNDYRQLHGSSIGENSEIQGEQGLTLNVSGAISANWQMQAMADWFSFGQPQYQTKVTPKDGYEGILRAIYSHSWLTTSVGYKIKSKNENLRHSLDAIITVNPNDHISTKTQLRKRINDSESVSHGFAIAQSINYKTQFLKKASINIEAQASYFDTDDYDTRIYIHEKNTLYGFGYPMLYGQGLRYNFIGQLKIGSNWSIEAKYALTNYANKKTISSGLQEIKGNVQNDLWLQVRLSY